MPLTAKQQRFCEEYLLDLNATRAAIRAGYSEKTAYSQADRLLKNVKLKSFIEAALLERSKRVSIDADWVLRRLIKELEADIAQLYDEGGELKKVADWPLIFRQGLINEIDLSRGKVRFSDRLKRLELLGKHIGVSAFKETVEHRGLDGLMDWLDYAECRDGDG
ncbi:MAG: phage terminase small subunit [Candidatus Tokpelaia sp. JSC189]|nr:MAG: phage terminase small subunit [Candidatus Tokpelaia sp. JSC189]